MKYIEFYKENNLFIYVLDSHFINELEIRFLHQLSEQKEFMSENIFQIHFNKEKNKMELISTFELLTEDNNIILKTYKQLFNKE